MKKTKVIVICLILAAFGVFASGRTVLAQGGREAAGTTRAESVYTGVGLGLSGDIHVRVTVANGEITGIEITQHSESLAFVDLISADIIANILEAQSVQGIDVVAGATGLSNGLIDAVADALGR